MRMLIAAACAGLALLGSAQAGPTTYTGKLWLVQTTGTDGTLRFMTLTTPRVSLFASGSTRDVMLEILMHKATASIIYTPTATCAGGITPPCGDVNTITLETSGF
jgi:hypothetical protein